MPQCPIGTFLYTIRPGDTLWKIAQQYNTTIEAIALANPGMNLNYLYIGQTICIRPMSAYYPSTTQPASIEISQAQADLKCQLHMLWEQHVFWTRLTILSIVFSLPDAEPVTKRLLQNPKDFESLLRPLYGTAIASKFADLFTNHLIIAAELVKAAKAGNTNAAASAEKRWYANADEIAAFLASINPYWSEDNWRTMLHEHLALTKAEAVNMLTQKYSDSISVMDKIEQQALGMANVMADGIVRQFPMNFQ